MSERVLRSIPISFAGDDFFLDLSSKENPIVDVQQESSLFINTKDDNLNYYIIYVTDNCNMRCKYCFNDINESRLNAKMEPSYSYEEFIRFLDRNEENEIGVRFFGGEPLMNAEWIYGFVNALNSSKYRVHYDIFTNASLLTEEFIGFAQQHNFRFFVSVNGGEDEYKGRIYKDAINKGVGQLIIKKFHVIGRMVYTPNRKEPLTNLVKESMDKGIQVLSFALPWGQHNSIDSLALFRSQLVDFSAFYLDNILKHNYDYMAVHPIIGYISKWILDGNYNIDMCGAGKSIVSISTDGLCYPCHCFNNIKKFSCGDIISGCDQLFNNRNAETTTSCVKCDLRFFCKSRCYADAYFTNGNCNIMNEYRCSCEKEIVACSAYILRRIMLHTDEFKVFKRILSQKRGEYDNNQ